MVSHWFTTKGACPIVYHTGNLISVDSICLIFIIAMAMSWFMFKGQVPMPPGKKFVIYKTSHSAPPIRIPLMRINPQPIRLPGIIINLIRAANQFSCNKIQVYSPNQ